MIVCMKRAFKGFQKELIPSPLCMYNVICLKISCTDVAILGLTPLLVLVVSDFTPVFDHNEGYFKNQNIPSG